MFSAINVVLKRHYFAQKQKEKNIYPLFVKSQKKLYNFGFL